jgi:hypothetical protein
MSPEEKGAAAPTPETATTPPTDHPNHHDQATRPDPSGEGRQSVGYAAVYALYLQKGWPSVLPLPPGSKWPPPRNCTGYEGRYPTDEEMAAWARQMPDANTALRLPPTVVAFDIDHFGEKRGGATFAEAERRWGPLEPTWRNSARPAPSGHRWYRIPEGTKLPGKIGFPELGLGHVEILQWFHRYAVTWPSINGDASAQRYEWYAPGDVPAHDLPGPVDFPELPPRWVEGLQNIAHTHPDPGAHHTGRDHPRAEFAAEDLYDVSDALTEGPMSQRVEWRLGSALVAVHGPGCRHDETLAHVLALLRLGKQGESGVLRALTVLMEAFVTEVTQDGSRSEGDARAEFLRFVTNPRARALLNEPANHPSADPEPVPLIQRAHVRPFPVDCLPKVYADMARTVSDSTQTDIAMAGTTALAVLAACTGGHAIVQVRHGWHEPLNLYSVTVAYPAERKSAVQKLMTAPLYAAERTLVEGGQAARTEAETTKAVAERECIRRTQEAARINTKDAATDEEKASARAEALNARTMLDSIVVPEVPRLIADDVTPEAVGSLLAAQGGRLAIISAEGGVFDIIAGRYSRLPNLDIWLKGHSGDPVKVDRQSRDPQYIEHPALTVALMIQPEVLDTIAARREFRGRGLLARFLYTRPGRRVGHRLIPGRR